MRISDWSSTCALPICLGLNAQWGLAGHLNFGIAGFFAVGAFTTALFTTAVPPGVLAQYAQQTFGLELPFLVGVAAAAPLAAVVGFQTGRAPGRERVWQYVSISGVAGS